MLLIKVNNKSFVFIYEPIACHSYNKLEIEGKTIAWLGDGNNVANSFIEAATKFKFELKIACPKKYQPDNNVVKLAKKNNVFVW